MASVDLESVARLICDQLHFVLAGRVGAGVFKETFQVAARDGTPNALKVFKPGASSARIPREIEAMLMCNHANIARLFSVSTFDFGGQTYLYLLEEFLGGGTLTQRLASRGKLSGQETLSLGHALADAVGHIASHGLVHRDLKPDNILFREDGTTPVIVDFGIARDLSETSLTPTWSLRGPGTPFYASPEQLNNEKAYLDWRADQFSLGVVLAVATFGFHPYQESTDTPDRVVDRVAQRGHRASRFMDATAATGLVALGDMTEPWPVQRFRTPALLATAWDSQRKGT